MEPLVKIVPNVKKFNSYFSDVKNRVTPIMLSGLTDSAKAHLAYSTSFYSERPICIVTYNEIQAKKLVKDLRFFTDKIDLFTKREIFAYDYLAESKDKLYERISVLNNIINKKSKVVVATIEAIMQPMIEKKQLYKNKISLKVGDICNLEEVKEKLVCLGYERYDLIEGRGQFSIRGGIIDIAVNEKEGIRIELWGDEIDSIRNFSITSQRSTDMLKKVDIYPTIEFVLENSIDEVCENIRKYGYTGTFDTIAEADIQEIQNGNYINKIDRYFNCFYNNTVSFLDYLSDDFIIFYDEIGKIKARTENVIKDTESIVKSIIEKKKIAPQILQSLKDYQTIVKENVDRQIIYLEKMDIGFVDKESMHAKRNGYSFSYREVNFFRSSMDLLLEEIQKAAREGKYAVILSGSKENAKKIANLLSEREIKHIYSENIKEELVSGVPVVTTGTISAGFECFDLKLLVIPVEEVFNAKPKKRKAAASFKEGETVIFNDLKIGDYIVHRTHGIGLYIGVNTIKADGITKDYIKVKYKDDDILYIPTNSLDNIRKFIGSGDGAPRLTRLGGKEWTNTKNKVKSNLREVARELIELYAKRQKMVGYAFSKDSAWQKEFEDDFKYVETDDQLRCIDEMKRDMEEPRPMDRLLCGDVGYGKTEVAMRGAFKAVLDQKQVAYLVPTTVLANQQYESFKERMEKFPIRVEVLNRFRTKKEQ